MHTFDSLFVRQPLLRSAIACAAFIAATASTGALAQDALAIAPRAPQAASMVVDDNAPAGRTRAEVVAELACARASGELDAAVLRSYGLEMAPVPRAGTGCSPTGGTALAGQPTRSATP